MSGSTAARLGDEKFVSLTTFKRNGDAGTGEVITDPDELARVESLIKHKYGLEFRVVTVVRTVAARGRKPRVVLRITPVESHLTRAASARVRAQWTGGRSQRHTEPGARPHRSRPVLTSKDSDNIPFEMSFEADHPSSRPSGTPNRCASYTHYPGQSR